MTQHCLAAVVMPTWPRGKAGLRHVARSNGPERKRLDVHIMDEEGESFEVSAYPSERHGLCHLFVHVRERYAGEEVMG